MGELKWTFFKYFSPPSFVYLALSYSYNEFQMENGHFAVSAFVYVGIASVAIGLPIGPAIDNAVNKWVKSFSVNWYPTFYFMGFFAILGLLPRFIGITEVSIYMVSTLAVIQISLVIYLDWDVRRNRKGKGQDPTILIPEDLTTRDDYPEFEELILKSRKYTKVDLSPLSACHNLRVLDLSFNELKTINLSPLSSCVNLQKLILDQNELREIDLSPLSSLQNLEWLYIQLNNLESISLEPLRNCENLQILHISGNQVQHIDLSPLEDCRELRHLGIDSFSPDIDLTPLRNCTLLESFSILGQEFKLIDLEPFNKCLNLEYLGFMAEVIEELDLSPLESCKKLNTIEFNENSPKYMDVTALFSIPEFEKLQGIDSGTRLWASHAPPDENQLPKGLRKYRKRIEVGHTSLHRDDE